MITNIIELFCLTIITVFIIDISGFIEHIKYWISKCFTKNKFTTTDWELKPFDCSLCMSWWIGLIWIFSTTNSSVWLYLITIQAVMSMLTSNLKDLIYFFKEILNKINNIL